LTRDVQRSWDGIADGEDKEAGRQRPPVEERPMAAYVLTATHGRESVEKGKTYPDR